MDGALDTLFAAAKAAAFLDINAIERVLFTGARYHPALRSFNSETLVLRQHFKPHEADLRREGFAAVPDTNIPSSEMFDVAFVLAPKNAIEARYEVAQALISLKPGGVLACAAGNKEGGNRLGKLLQDFGVDQVQQISMNKARAAIGIRRRDFSEAVERALKAGQPQFIEEGTFISQPGVFSWNRIDKGSLLLTQHIPANLEGVCGDFGCGFGYLSRHAVEHNPGIREIVCVDADYRALQLSEKNLESYKVRKRFIWDDLGTESRILRDLDVIVMNPPFHEGKRTDTDLGRRFIAPAARALRAGGMLHLVANRHLPYEDLLQELFSDFHTVVQAEGFKVFRARK